MISFVQTLHDLCTLAAMKYRTGDRVWFLAKQLSARQQAAFKEHGNTLNIGDFRVYATVNCSMAVPRGAAG
jgi:hypothetical protein